MLRQQLTSAKSQLEQNRQKIRDLEREKKRERERGDRHKNEALRQRKRAKRYEGLLLDTLQQQCKPQQFFRFGGPGRGGSGGSGSSIGV